MKICFSNFDCKIFKKTIGGWNLGQTNQWFQIGPRIIAHKPYQQKLVDHIEFYAIEWETVDHKRGEVLTIEIRPNEKKQ